MEHSSVYKTYSVFTIFLCIHILNIFQYVNMNNSCVNMNFAIEHVQDLIDEYATPISVLPQ